MSALNDPRLAYAVLQSLISSVGLAPTHMSVTQASLSLAPYLSSVRPAEALVHRTRAVDTLTRLLPAFHPELAVQHAARAELLLSIAKVRVCTLVRRS